MPTVLRIAGVRCFSFSDEFRNERREPAHLRVERAEAYATFRKFCPSSVSMAASHDLRSGELAEMRRLVEE